MPIINCPECGGKVSTLANTCPHCGITITNSIIQVNADTHYVPKKNKQNKFNKKLMLTILLPLIAIIILSSVSYSLLSLDKAEQQKVDQLIENIDNLPEELSVADFNAVKVYYENYDKMQFKQKIQVKNCKTLDKALTIVCELKIETIIDAINEIQEVSTEKKEQLDEILKEYTSLPEKEKKKVTNYSVLEEAIKKCNDLFVKETIDLIDGIGTVTISALDSIVAAEKAYNNLDTDLKSKITNYNDLVSAREQLDIQLVQNVTELIDNIGTISLESESAITSARTMYEELSFNNKAKVTNYSKLTSAEDKLRELKIAKEEAEKLLSSGEIISNDQWQVTYKRTNLSAEIYPNNTNGYYTYYYCDDDQIFVDIVFEIKNIDTELLKIQNLVDDVTVTYDQTYEYNLYNLYVSEGNDIDKIYYWDAIDALDSTTLHIAIPIPREAKSNSNSIFITLEIAGQEKTIDFR